MLIVFQVPLTDLRPFRREGSRKDCPHWPTPDAGTEFIRFFGPVRERNKRNLGSLLWADEQFFVDASRALLFPPPTGKGIPVASWRCAFRRLLSDGGAVVRFEVAFSRFPALAPPVIAGERPQTVLDTVAALLEKPCILRGEKQPQKLVLLSKRIAALYARATATRGTRLKGDEVVAGQPAVLVQYDAADTLPMPTSLDFDSDHLAFMKSSRCGVTMNLWFTNPDFADPRRARTTLLRLNAEHQSLKLVLRDVAAGNVELTSDSEQSQKLQRYFASADKTLSSPTRFGVDQNELVRLTQIYETLCAGRELELLRQKLDEIRPQIRNKVLALVDSANSTPSPLERTGPEFQWHGEFGSIEYQAFFSSPRPPMDVAWLADVTERLCPAVCLISVPAINRKATGFLVGKDLILTNWHVIQEVPGEVVQTNLEGMELCFTRSQQPARVFKLLSDGQAALVQGSPVEELDFALLRVAEDVSQALGVQPFRSDLFGKAVPKKGIHIIQHPGGGPQMLSVDENGISDVDPKAGTVQYISKAQPGSSGSPCIDGEKRLVALHHAEVSNAFYSAREGILLSTIYPRIAPYLG